ncbi:MAG: NADH:ubiquinone oxidoreductase subunit NDUFA12 [Rhodospirillales bacterium]|nr:NADH:ubiquinone oxidoreductase subunit NDUFA12 [Rhodospirillales bacterium]
MNIGTLIHTWLHGRQVGHDETGNRYFEERRPRGRRARRWVLYAGAAEASAVPPEWHAWLHYLVDAPLTGPRRAWQAPHLANQTGTPAAYRPAGHDYAGGHRQAATGDYEAWTPGT